MELAGILYVVGQEARVNHWIHVWLVKVLHRTVHQRHTSMVAWQ